jgi:hypothetical protein
LWRWDPCADAALGIQGLDRMDPRRSVLGRDRFGLGIEGFHVRSGWAFEDDIPRLALALLDDDLAGVVVVLDPVRVQVHRNREDPTSLTTRVEVGFLVLPLRSGNV